VLAYVFLSAGAVEPLSAFVWPTPRNGEQSAWLDADAAPSEALRGYPADDLPYWPDDELWKIELAGPIAERDHVLVAQRARLLGRIDSWSEPLAWEFVGECARRVARRAAAALHEDGLSAAAASLDRARDLRELERASSSAADHPREAGKLAGYVADVCFYARDARVGPRAAGVAAKMSAVALAGDAGDAPRYDERLAQERAWQADWLVDRLGIRSPGSTL
jgi:hypothetical protein